MILVDSSVWVAYFNGTISPETDKLNSLLGVAQIATGDLILTEVLQGFRSDKEFRTAKELLTCLPIYNILNTTIALKSADNYRFLRKKGITIRKKIDTIIATFCIENDHALLHCDKDFEPFHKKLKLIDVLDGHKK